MHDSSAAVGAKVTAFDAAVIAWRIPAAHRIRTLDELDMLRLHNQRHAKSARGLLLAITAVTNV